MAAALEWAGRGWHVFPLRPSDKRPAVRDWENRATTDPARIERCWATGPWNIGIATGPSGLVVVDLDMPKTLPLDDSPVPTGADRLAELAADHGGIPATFTVTTASGGRHLYFTHPSGGPQLRNTTGRLAELIDTRGHGGYVVAAGSVVPKGMYTVEDDRQVAPLPGWIAERVAPTTVPPVAGGPVRVAVGDDRRGAYLAAAIDGEARKVSTAPEGQRNHTLYTAAIALGQLVAGGELADTDARLVLSQAAAEAGLWLGESARTITSGLRAGAARPRSLAGIGGGGR